MAVSFFPDDLHLRLYPDVILRVPCDPVERFGGSLADIVHEMFLLMRIHRGIGLAAPQVGINWRFFVAGIGEQRLCLINPVIESLNGTDRMSEGCLSLPRMEVELERSTGIEVSSQGLDGKKRQEVFQGLWARVVQHEVDHLNGILICDYASASPK